MPAFTSDNWDKAAAQYKQLAATIQQSGPTAALLSQANDYLPFSKATAILDNGCGPGPVTNQIIATYGDSLSPDCKLTAADYSKGMIDEVVKRREEAPSDSTWKRVKSLVQDATDLADFEDGSQSHVLANMVYFMTPDPFKCLTESRRVLKEGGVLSLSSMEKAQWLDCLDEYKKVRPDLEKKIMPASWRNMVSLRKELERASFRNVTIERVEMTIDVESYERQISILWNMAPMQDTRTRFSEYEWKTVFEMTKQKMAELCPREPGTLKGSLLVATARK